MKLTGWTSGHSLFATMPAALFALACDNDFTVPVGEMVQAETVEALSPESPERWRAELLAVVAENPGYRTFLELAAPGAPTYQFSETLRTWQRPPGRMVDGRAMYCGNQIDFFEQVETMIAEIENRGARKPCGDC